MELNEAEIDLLFSNGSLEVSQRIEWKKKKGHSHYEFSVPIENKFNGQKIRLLLFGTKNCFTKDYSYCILHNKQRIRALDPYKDHMNHFPKKERIQGTHKHKWLDQIKSTYAYQPTDITDVSDMELTFLQFLNECSIKFSGEFIKPPAIQYEIPSCGY